MADKRPPTAHADVRRQLLGYRRLADARLAHDHQQRPPPGQRGIERPLQLLQLLLAAHERAPVDRVRLLCLRRL